VIRETHKARPPMKYPKSIAHILTSFMLLSSIDLAGLTITWDGVTPSVTLNTNWVGDVTPGVNDVAQFGVGGASVPVITTTQAISWQGINFADSRELGLVGPAASLVIGSSGVLVSPSLIGEIQLVNGATVTNNGPGASTSGTINYLLDSGANSLILTSGQSGAALLNIELSTGTNICTISNTMRVNNVDIDATGALSITAGQLTLGSASNMVIDGSVVGAGGLIKVGTGLLELNNTSNAYTGGTNIQSGVIAIPSTAALGNLAGTPTVTLGKGVLTWSANDLTAGVAITTNGTGTSIEPSVIDTQGFVVTIGTFGTKVGSLAGSGFLQKQGTGELHLENSSSGFTGTIHIAQGTLIGQGSATSIPSVNIINDGTLSFSQGVPVSYTANISDNSNTGVVTIRDGTDLTFSGSNSYGGGTTIVDGSSLTAQGQNLPPTANILIDTNLDTLNINQTIDGTYTGTISGLGVFNKTGAAKLSLTGLSLAFDGLTNLSAGELRVTSFATLGGDFNMTAGVLSGNGTIGALGCVATISGGIIRPGDSIGTLLFGGDYIQSGGEYEVELTSNGNLPGFLGNNDLISVNEQATLSDPAFVRAISLDGSYFIGGAYTILTANGGVSGTYSPIVLTNTLLVPELTYDSNNVYLDFRNPFRATAYNHNGRAVADQLFTISDPDDAEAEMLFNITALPPEEIGVVLDFMSGSQYSVLLLANEASTHQFSRRLYDPMRSFVTADPCSDWNFTLGGVTTWIEGGGIFSNFNSSLQAHGFRANGYQITGGIQSYVTPSTVVGAALTYEHSQTRFYSTGTGDIDSFMGALYAAYRRDESYLLGNILLGGNRCKVTRFVDIGPILYSEKGTPEAIQGLIYGEYGHDFRFGWLLLQPFVGIEADYYSYQSFAETGDAPLALRFNERSYGSVDTRLGVHILTPGYCDVVFGLDLAWNYRCTPLNNIRYGEFISFGDYFQILGSNLNRSSFEATLNYEERLSQCWSIFATGYWQQWSNGSVSGGLGGIAFRW
jgi:fibronectin-binding autotransporter adhesin